uniref:Uncharacterized protein n=1 Tax=Oryza glumipatula TaxID=40148 RepID=A0A0E0A625_9ORYZ
MGSRAPSLPPPPPPQGPGAALVGIVLRLAAPAVSSLASAAPKSLSPPTDLNPDPMGCAAKYLTKNDMAFVISREPQRLNKEVNFAAFLDNPNIDDVHNQSILLWSYNVIPATATSTEICRLFSSVVQTIERELGQGGVLVARRTHADSADTISFNQLA